MENVIKELKEYADLSMDETGEVTNTLIYLWYKRNYLLDTFGIELAKELRSQLYFYKSNYKIVNKEYTETYKELDYIDD